MPNLLHLSERASLALHAMVILADRAKTRLNGRQILEMLPAPDHRAVEVMQQLAEAQLVHPSGSSDGGFRLAKPAHETSLLEIWEAIDGPQSDQPCFFDQPFSDGFERLLDETLRPVRDRLRDYFATTTLAELAQGAPRHAPEA